MKIGNVPPYGTRDERFADQLTAFVDCQRRKRQVAADRFNAQPRADDNRVLLEAYATAASRPQAARVSVRF